MGMAFQRAIELSDILSAYGEKCCWEVVERTRDGYFDGDDEFDAAAFAQMDAIEAAYAASNLSRASSLATNTAAPTVTKPKSATKEASFYDLTLDLDEEEMGKLDAFIADSYANMEKPRSKTGSMRQTTLHGDILPSTPQPSKPGPSRSIQRTVSSPRNIFVSKAKKTKVWDQTAFAKTGQRKKGKGKRFDEYEEEEPVEFEQFPAPFVSPVGPPPPMKLKPDLLEAKHWVYPLNKPKRDFQYNIVKHSLFENTIISIPTGMGKTFIAGVVMLNYYRWFPDGKVIFVAPTRPLVTQQIHASHKSCGIPGSDAAEMTGEVSRAKREKLWREKRVFYMTPQTLMNDLTSENCDVMDIVLLIVDEAHRATGDYAYNQIVRHMMAKNPHFRLIALTATPGKDTEAVQNLVDGLHISRIEIRNEESIDLRGYMHDKNVEQHCIKMPEGIAAIRDALERLMETYLKPLQAMGIMWPNQHAVKLHPYAARAKISTLAPHQRGSVHQLSMLGNLAQVMAYLLEATVGMAYSYLKEISEKDMDDQARKNQQAQSKKLRENILFKKALAAFESHRSTMTGSFLNHPKMEKATDILVKYYGQMLPQNDHDESEENWGRSKAMVFVTHREAVDEIVEALNSHQPMLRASKFVGQGTDKNGKKGQTQKEQLEVIDKFQKGTFNVLVATCVGEEGLDIGEVDLIICYDAQKTPIRMLQRFGRTGRERAGFVHVLLAEEREEFNLEKARLTYKEVQRAISRGDDLEFYSDVKRLLPDHIKPLPLERIMEIKPYVREETSKAKRSPKKSLTKAKRKRNDDVMRNVPDGACTGFVSVADLIVNQSKRRKVVDVKTLDDEAEDDDLDKALEAGVDGLLCGNRSKSSVTSLHPWDEGSLHNPEALGKAERARSGSSRSTTKPATKSKSRKKATETDGSQVKGKRGGKMKTKGKKKETSLSLSQQGRDDSVDRELEDNPFVREISRTRKTRPHGSPISPSHSRSPESPKRRTKICTPSPSPAHEITIPDPPDQEQRPLSPFTQMGSRLNNRNDPDDLTWVINDDDDDPDIVILSSSPVVHKDEPHDDSIGRVDIASSHSHKKGTGRSESQSQPVDCSVLDISSDMPSSPPRWLGTSPETKVKKAGCPPPSVYKTPSVRTQAFETTQPVRRAIRRPVRHNLSVISSSDAELEMHPPSQRRLRRLQDSLPEPEEPKPKQKKRKPLTKRKHNALLDYTAEHSGDDVSSGLSNSDDDVESESDRLFIKNSPMTQIPSSYDQTLMYRKSLMTQAPVEGPDFHEGPIRNKPFGRMEPRKRRRVVDSSPPPEDDEYEFGSFVVDNDAEISYLTQVDEFS